MGATYISMHVADTPRDEVRTACLDYIANEFPGLAVYLGETVGRWTAIYPRFSAESDMLAKRLSGRLQRIVITPGSVDEDDFLCNVCRDGKDLGFFKISVGTVRKAGKRETVAKRLELLSGFAGTAARAGLLEKLCDTRNVTFSSELLTQFCEVFGISNGRGNFDYIARGDYAGDFDVAVKLELLGNS